MAAGQLGRLSGSIVSLSRLEWSWAASAASQKTFGAFNKPQKPLVQRLWRLPEEVTQSPCTWCACLCREGVEAPRHNLGKCGSR